MSSPDCKPLVPPICRLAAQLTLRRLRAGLVPQKKVVGVIEYIRTESIADFRMGGFDPSAEYTVLQASPEEIVELNKFLPTALQQIGAAG